MTPRHRKPTRCFDDVSTGGTLGEARAPKPTPIRSHQPAEMREIRGLLRHQYAILDVILILDEHLLTRANDSIFSTFRSNGSCCVEYAQPLRCPYR
jgi:hypothetical protein